jgi:hypothetical protein
VQPVAVDRLGGDDTDRDSRRAARDGAEEYLASVLGHLFRVVQKGEWANAVVAQALVVEENARDDQRSGEAPATSLIRPGNEPRTESSVESEKSSAGPAHALRIDVAVGRGRWRDVLGPLQNEKRDVRGYGGLGPAQLVDSRESERPISSRNGSRTCASRTGIGYERCFSRTRAFFPTLPRR